MLHLRNVSYRDGTRTLVDDVDLDIEPGSVTVLLGSHEAGAGTLLRLIGGDLTPSSGSIDSDERRPIARMRLDAGDDGDESLATSPYLVVDDTAAERPLATGRRGRDHACRLVRACARFASRGAGVIAALRDVDLAAAFADRIVLMHGGQVVADGDPEIVLDPAFVGWVFARRRLAT